MPHVMPRARSSKSSGRVRQIKQRSAEQGCGCWCWCSGAVWVDGWADFGAFLTVGTRLFNVCAAAGEAWMLAARLSVSSGVLTAASMLSNAEMQFCARTRGLPLQVDVVGARLGIQNREPALSSCHVSVGCSETCWSERRPRHCHRGPRRAAAAAEARFTPKTATDRPGAVLLTADDSRAGVGGSADWCSHDSSFSQAASSTPARVGRQRINEQ